MRVEHPRTNSQHLLLVRALVRRFSEDLLVIIRCGAIAAELGLAAVKISDRSFGGVFPPRGAAVGLPPLRERGPHLPKAFVAGGVANRVYLMHQRIIQTIT